MVRFNWVQFLCDFLCNVSYGAVIGSSFLPWNFKCGYLQQSNSDKSCRHHPYYLHFRRPGLLHHCMGREFLLPFLLLNQSKFFFSTT